MSIRKTNIKKVKSAIRFDEATSIEFSKRTVGEERHITNSNVAYVICDDAGFHCRFYSTKEEMYIQTKGSSQHLAQDTCDMLRKYWNSKTQQYEFPLNQKQEAK